MNIQRYAKPWVLHFPPLTIRCSLHPWTFTAIKQMDQKQFWGTSVRIFSPYHLVILEPKTSTGEMKSYHVLAGRLAGYR